jgi:MFS family permease
MSHESFESPTVVIGVFMSMTAAVWCALTMRHSTRSTFTLDPLRSGLLRNLLTGVGIVSLVGMLTYVTIALEYLYDLSPLRAAILLVPAQLGAVVGAKFLAAWAMHRWGVSIAARRLTIAIAVAVAVTVLPLLAMQSTTPAWYLISSAAIFSCMGMAALTVLNAEVMGQAPRESTGAVSSFRAAASSIGGALGVAILGTPIISAVSVDEGVGSVSQAQLDQITAGLRLDAVLACMIATVGWAILTRAARRSQAMEPT